MIDFKAIFFDMDGVLYNSMPNHEYTWCAAFAAEGITFGAEEAYINEGRTGRGTINLVFNREYGRDATDAEVDRIYGRKTDLMRSRPAPEMMPCMHSLVENLRQAGIATYVVTGSKQPTLMEKLHRDYGFAPEQIVSGADVKYGKPNPEPYLIALARSGYEAHECAVVENAPMGVRAAKAAQLFTYAVNTGKLANSYLTDENADTLYASTAHLAQHFAQACLAARKPITDELKHDLQQYGLGI